MYYKLHLSFFLRLKYNFWKYSNRQWHSVWYSGSLQEPLLSIVYCLLSTNQEVQDEPAPGAMYTCSRKHRRKELISLGSPTSTHTQLTDRSKNMKKNWGNNPWCNRYILRYATIHLYCSLGNNNIPINKVTSTVKHNPSHAVVKYLKEIKENSKTISLFHILFI